MNINVHNYGNTFVFNTARSISYIVAETESIQNLSIPSNIHSMFLFCFLSPKIQFPLDELMELRSWKREEEDEFVDPSQELVSAEVSFQYRPHYPIRKLSRDG